MKHLGVAKSPNRSTLSYANEHRPCQLYQKIFYQLLDKTQALTSKARNILTDQMIELEGYYSKGKCSYLLRRIEVWDEENEQIIVLLTNHHEFGPTTIASIYKDRWQTCLCRHGRQGPMEMACPEFIEGDR